MKHLLFILSTILSIYLLKLGYKNVSNNSLTDLNRLVIDSINVDIPMYIGHSVSLLEKGVVVDPNTLNKNNIVIFGHRYSNKHPLKKYLIKVDKVKIGDKVKIFLNTVEYNYIVEKIFTVNPNELWVLSQTQEKTLTIITCTPIYNPINRLIIISRLLRNP